MKKVFKIMSLVLASILAFDIPAQAAEIQVDRDGYSLEDVTYQSDDEETFTNETNVFAYIGSSYKVTIPKTVVLSGITKSAEYFVKVNGDIAGYEAVNVIPDENFELSSINKSTKTATITQDKTSWSTNDFDTDVFGKIEATDLDAGAWEGSFNFTISLTGVAGDIVLPTLISNEIDVYSAAVDEIYYLNGEEKKIVCTTDSNGHGVIPADTLKTGDYTFYSSIAKNPDNLDENYSQKMTLTNSLDETSIELLPVEKDKILYWYGYRNTNILENMTTENGWSRAPFNSWGGTVKYEQNSIALSAGGTINGVGSKKTITTDAVHFIVHPVGMDADHSMNDIDLGLGNVKNRGMEQMRPRATGNVNQHVSMYTDSQKTGYLHCNVLRSCTATLYAMWYE